MAPMLRYVLLFLLLVLSALKIHGYEELEPVPQELEEKSPHWEFPYSGFDYSAKLQEVKRAIYAKSRGMQKCGKGVACPAAGVCCGPKRCCRKGWTCRYMPNIRSFYCIP